MLDLVGVHDTREATSFGHLSAPLLLLRPVLQQELRDAHAAVARRRPQRRGAQRVARVDGGGIGGQEALDHVRVAHAWPVFQCETCWWLTKPT